MKPYITSLVLVLIFLIVGNSFSQGCSDAGVCTLSGFQSHSAEVEKPKYQNLIGLGISLGKGDEDVSVITPYLNYTRVLNPTFSLSSKLTYSSASGELGDHSGLGDLFLTGNWVAQRQATNELSFTGGLKIPLSKADGGDGILSLPMDYQSSLETLDLIAGAAYSHNCWGFNAGVQLPLTSENSNSFLVGSYSDPRAAKYLSTNKFTRNGDFLLRVSYEFPLQNSRWKIRPSLLPIYHLGEDAYIDANGNEQTIIGSDGLTLNGNVLGEYQLSLQSALELSVGMPFATRDARPDGLTRKFVATFEYKRSF